MAEQISLESLNLKKPLEKMTAKELRELAIDKIPQIVGASGMDKEELLHEIKTACGLIDEESNISQYKEQIWNIKREMRKLRDQKHNLPKSEQKEKDRLRKQIKKMKRQTRSLAATK
ncbi:MAG TPA: hypothetical protein VKN82_04440 [Desulfohalobiaceae bacterium]|nr:hypothetical protein [Desulfohalobiaceae bacterium]